MNEFLAVWPRKAIKSVLAPLSDGKLLHQGWSPRCEPEPSRDASEWAALKTTAIQDGWYDSSYNKRLPSSLTPRPEIEVHAGDILITCAGPRVRCGIACLVRETRARLMISGKMYRLRANEKDVTAEFLVAYLRSPEGQGAIDKMKTGGSESGLNLTHDRFLQLLVPVPPLDEQQLVAAKLSRLTDLSKAAHSELVRIPKLVERYKRAVLAAVMEADSNGQEWPRVPLESLILDGPTNGYSPRAGENPDGTLSLKLTATTQGVFDLSDRAVKRLNEVISPSSKFWLRPGDILIQRANSIEYVGIAAIFDGPADTFIYPDLMMRVRATNPVVARWIWRYCSSAAGRSYFTSRATGTSGSMPKINGQTIRQMPIPMPPPSIISTLLARIDQALDSIEVLLEESGRAKKLLDRLGHRTLAKGFRGEFSGAEVLTVPNLFSGVHEKARRRCSRLKKSDG